jgi:type III pantothenate kinase
VDGRTRLTVDLGNTRLKARTFGASVETRPRSRWDGGHDELAGFARWLADERPAAAALASVASTAVTARVRELLEAHCTRTVEAPPSGLAVQAVGVGADRIYAALGALRVAGGSCVVVDAGTALTVDALEVSGSTARFRGGAIAPGPDLAAIALGSGTARLPRVEPRPGASAPGATTEDALRAGIGIGFRGAAGLLVEQVAAGAGLGGVPVVLTGGAREFLLVPAPFTQRPVHVEPELVHLGLLHALGRLGSP